MSDETPAIGAPGFRAPVTGGNAGYSFAGYQFSGAASSAPMPVPLTQPVAPQPTSHASSELHPVFQRIQRLPDPVSDILDDEAARRARQLVDEAEAAARAEAIARAEAAAQAEAAARKAEAAAKERAEREAKVKAELEAKEQAELAEKEKAEREAAARERFARETAARNARLEAAYMDDEPAPFEIMAEQAAKEAAARREAERKSAEKAAAEEAARKQKERAAAEALERAAAEREAQKAAAAKQAALERAAADEAAKMALREKMARKAEREAKRAEREASRAEVVDGEGRIAERVQAKRKAAEAEAEAEATAAATTKRARADKASDAAASTDEKAADDEEVRKGSENGGSSAAASKPRKHTPNKKALPEGWTEKIHEAKARSYSTFHGPGGLRARSVAEAWRMHGEAGTDAAAPAGAEAEDDADAAVGAEDNAGEDAASKDAAITNADYVDSSDEEDRSDPMLDKRIHVYWTGERSWFAGVVAGTKCERGRRIHEVFYDADQIKCWHKLDGPGKVKWKPEPVKKAKAPKADLEEHQES